LYYLSLQDSTGEFDLFRSLDGGVSWDSGPIASVAGDDKPWMVIDKTGGIGCGNIYVCSFASAGADWFMRSTDGGFNFVRLSPTPQLTFASTMAIGPDGELYIAGHIGGNVWVLKSTDARDPNCACPTFTSSMLPGCGGFPGSGLQDGSCCECPVINPNPGGTYAQTWVACDVSSTSTRGNVYVLRSMDPPVAAAIGCSEATDDCGIGITNDPLDIWFWRSTDGGATWNAPKRVNDDPCRAKAWQWHAAMSIAPDGRLDAIWNDNRAYRDETPFNVRKSQLYYSSSKDGGLSWSVNQPVSDCWFAPCGKNGDYYHMISDDEGAHLAWAATFDELYGIPRGVYYMRINDFTSAPAATGCPAP
jgi:hypothetical protein